MDKINRFPKAAGLLPAAVAVVLTLGRVSFAQDVASFQADLASFQADIQADMPADIQAASF